MTEFMSNNKTKARHFHSTKPFMDDLGAVNEVDKYKGNYIEIYLKETELMLEHQSPLCILILLNCNINIMGRKIV